MEQLRKAFEQMGIPLSEEMESQFKIYMEGILQWNEKINLTAITDPDEFIDKHLIDSVLCYSFEEYQNGESVIDVGTGAGFPGIPLAIVSCDKSFVLADSLNKRLKVIDSLTDEAGIGNVTTVHGRAEELARMKTYRQAFDICVSRAVANLAVLSEYCLPFVRKGGFLLAYKGPDAEREAADAAKAIRVLGGRISRIQSVARDGFDHNIVVIEKIKDTPAKYPRKAGTPSKEPIL
ncbi:MAG: 16S rRNA (guanine(527)-N(7))-methyltransferase RsmG [Emergencia sp.]